MEEPFTDQILFFSDVGNEKWKNLQDKDVMNKAFIASGKREMEKRETQENTSVSLILSIYQHKPVFHNSSVEYLIQQ